MNRPETFTVEEFERVVGSAFCHRHCPRDHHIVDRWLGTPGHPSEEAWEFYRGKTWEEILELGRTHDPRVTLEHFKVRGFAYYLPVFLLLSLELHNPLDVRKNMLDRLRAVPEKIAHWLHPRGKRVVVQGLEYLAELHEQHGMTPNSPAQALDEYWAYFTDAELGLSKEASHAVVETQERNHP